MSDFIDEKDKEIEEESFDLQGLLFEYLAQWKWFLICVVACSAIAYYYVSTIIPTYTVSASIYLSDDNAGKSSAVSLGQGSPMMDVKSYIDETEIEIMKSRNNLIKIVDSLDLAYSYYKVERLRDCPIYGTNAVEAKLDSISLRNLTSPITIYASKEKGTYKFDVKTTYGGVEEEKTVKSDTLPIAIELSQGTLNILPSRTTSALEGVQKIKIENPSWVAARLSGSLSISYARNSATILRISCTTSLPPQGIDVIKTLVSIYNQDIIAEKNLSALQTEAFIIERLALIAGELQDVEIEVEKYRRDKQITDISAEAGMYLSQTSEADQRLADVDAKNEMVSSVEKIVSTQDDYTPIPQVIDDPALSAMIDAYNKKLAQRAAMLEGGTENNPIVQNMQEDLARSKNEIYRGLSNVKQGLNIIKAGIRRQDSRISGKLSNIPVYERELTGIFREQRVKDNIYNFLLEKREEIALQKTLATPTARFIDNPSGGSLVAPHRDTYVGIAAIIGLLIPAVIIFLRRLFFPIFKDKEDLERATKVSVIGEVCLAEKAEKDENFVVEANATTPIAELFRLVRNNIQFVHSERDKKVLLVTSSLSGEGKTFVAANLALTFAVAGKKTLVIGMDIRRPVLAKIFGMNNRSGVTTYLSKQEEDIEKLIKPSGRDENLWVLPAGPVPPNPNELLLSEQNSKMFDVLRKKFDIVIVDTAPIGVVSDTFLITPHSDIQLYVARANYSTKRCLKVLHEATASGRLKNCYLILNGVDIRSSYYFYRRYGHYGIYNNQGYGYGYAHIETPSLKSRMKRLKRRIFKK